MRCWRSPARSWSGAQRAETDFRHLWRGIADQWRSLSVLVARVKSVIGGAWGRWEVRVGCARTPSLISVRDPGWLRVGDMMGDGVFRDAVRPLGL
jgi:hypothetical protein